VLARHGALIIEEGHQHAAPVRRLCVSRAWARAAAPRYAAAFQAIGPAAIKLGQTLATRPDLVGEDAARDLLSLQDSLPPVPFRADPCGDRNAASAQPLDALYAGSMRSRSASASIAQVHRAVRPMAARLR
jgi:ubiquinone biosynthesis protein